MSQCCSPRAELPGSDELRISSDVFIYAYHRNISKTNHDAIYGTGTALNYRNDVYSVAFSSVLEYKFLAHECKSKAIFFQERIAF